jgi:hypothetical protein
MKKEGPGKPAPPFSCSVAMGAELTRRWTAREKTGCAPQFADLTVGP